MNNTANTLASGCSLEAGKNIIAVEYMMAPKVNIVAHNGQRINDIIALNIFFFY
jgi:hypothetical protein